MAKVTKVTINRGITINKGNYESERFDASVEVLLDKGDDPTIIAGEMGAECNKMLALQLLHRLSTGRESIVAKLMTSPSEKWSSDQKIARLKRCPEFAWVELLHQTYADQLVNLLREGAAPSIPQEVPFPPQDEMDQSEER